MAEVKWTDRPVSMTVLDDLRRRVSIEPALSGLAITFGLVVKNRVERGRRLRSDERMVELGKLRRFTA